MDSEKFARLKKLFDGLADLSPPEREAYLAKNELGDDTRRSLQELLDADEALVGSTARRVTAGPGVFMDSQVHPWQGRKVGGFIIERELGRGGMGNVFLAHRANDSVSQDVALKLVRPERIDANTLARFRLERQVLAVLKHPHIATLLDAGELDDGTPFVAMEYIEGQPILEFAKSQELGLRRRLELFLAVCDAVSYAHRNMVVHRDIKSSNILVTAEGMPKLLDFGIAKPLIARLGVHDIEQTSEAHRFFSPYNAAPEQIRGDAITVACDVYGLGTLLYELLAGTPPFDFADKTPAQIEHAILQTEPPPPSQRASTTSAVSARLLRGDLDAIVLRALRKDPAYRYVSVDSFADDVQRYLQGLPVSARKATYRYRLGRFISRHRVALGATAVVGTVVAALGWTSARQYLSTQQERARADSVTGILFQAIESVDPGSAQGKELSAREVFQQASILALHENNIDDATRNRLVRTVAKIYARLNLPKDALSLLDEGKALENASTAKDRSEVLQILVHTTMNISQLDRATEYVATGLKTAPAEDVPAWRLLQAQLEIEKSDLEPAKAHLEALVSEAGSIDAETERGARETLGDLLFNLDIRDQAYAQATILLQEQRERLPAIHPGVLKAVNSIAYMAVYMEKKEEALKFSQEAKDLSEKLYGANSLPYAESLDQLASALAKLHREDEAIGMARNALEISVRLLGDENSEVSGRYFSLGNLLDSVGNYLEAEKFYDRALSIAERNVPPKSLRLYLFRVIAACNKTLNDEAAASEKITAAAEESMKLYPELANYDIKLVLKLVEAINGMQRSPNAANRKVVDEAVAAGRKGAEDGNTRDQVELMVKFANTLRVH